MIPPPADSPRQIYDAVYRELEAARAEIERLRALLNAVRIWMKNIDRRESEEPLYRAICAACAALEPKP